MAPVIDWLLHLKTEIGSKKYFNVWAQWKILIRGCQWKILVRGCQWKVLVGELKEKNCIKDVERFTMIAELQVLFSSHLSLAVKNTAKNNSFSLLHCKTHKVDSTLSWFNLKLVSLVAVLPHIQAWSHLPLLSPNNTTMNTCPQCLADAINQTIKQ